MDRCRKKVLELVVLDGVYLSMDFVISTFPKRYLFVIIYDIISIFMLSCMFAFGSILNQILEVSFSP